MYTLPLDDNDEAGLLLDLLSAYAAVSADSGHELEAAIAGRLAERLRAIAPAAAPAIPGPR